MSSMPSRIRLSLLLPVCTASLTLTSDRAHGDQYDDLQLITTFGSVAAFGMTASGIYLRARMNDEAYVDKNQQAIRLTLARGDGPFASDLAAHCGLARADVPRVGAGLRNARSELELMLKSNAPGHSAAFIAAARDVLRRDSMLAPRIEVPGNVGERSERKKLGASGRAAQR